MYEMPRVREGMFQLCSENGWEILDQNLQWGVEPYQYSIQVTVQTDNGVGILTTTSDTDTVGLYSLRVNADEFDEKTFEKQSVIDRA